MRKIGFLLLAVIGCQSEGPGTEAPPLTANQLRRIALTYNDCGDAKRRPPTKLEDLHPFFHGNVFPPESGKRDRDTYQAIKDGKYTVVWGIKGFQDRDKHAKYLLAYESRAKQTGGYGIFADARIEWLSADQLEKALGDIPKQE